MSMPIVVHPHNGILSHKKEWSIDNMLKYSRCWKHYAKWKSDTKGHILFVSIYMRNAE